MRPRGDERQLGYTLLRRKTRAAYIEIITNTRSMSVGLQRLLSEPGVLETPAIEQAVNHHRDAVHPRVVAGAEAGLIDDRAGGGLLQPAGRLPDQPFLPFFVPLDLPLL